MDSKIKQKALKNGSTRPMLYRYDILKQLAHAHGYSRYKIVELFDEMVERGEITAKEAISRTTVEAIFQGNSCNVESLWALSKLFNVPMMRLFDFDDVLLEQDKEKAS